jgi:putative hemolysin
VLWHLGHLPKVAESFVENGVRYEVIDLDGNRIDKVLVKVDQTEP